MFGFHEYSSGMHENAIKIVSLKDKSLTIYDIAHRPVKV
jgi:hypothetical protein